MRTREIDAASGILLDFDGPVCKVFAGLPAPGVAAELLALLHRLGGKLDADRAVNALSENWSSDPLAVLRASGQQAPSIVIALDEALRAAELAASTTAQPSIGVREFLSERAKRAQPVLIVSNNGEPAIRAYLSRHELSDLVTGIHARPIGRPDLMKPSPYLLQEAAKAIGQPARHLVMIGDSATDVAAARAANMTVVGIANKPDKVSRLIRAGSDLVVNSLADLLAAESVGDLT